MHAIVKHNPPATSCNIRNLLLWFDSSLVSYPISNHLSLPLRASLAFCCLPDNNHPNRVAAMPHCALGLLFPSEVLTSNNFHVFLWAFTFFALKLLLCKLLSWMCYFVAVEFWSPFKTLDSKLLSDKQLASIFSHGERCVFPVFIVSFAEQTLLGLIEFLLSGVACTFGVLLNTSLSISMSGSSSLLFSSTEFVFLLFSQVSNPHWVVFLLSFLILHFQSISVFLPWDWSEMKFLQAA